MAAFGGLTCLTFEKNGDVIIEPLRVAAEIHDQLENNLILFFTGTERSASQILRDQDTKSKKNNRAMVENLHHIFTPIGKQRKNAHPLSPARLLMNAMKPP
jgi:D-glycero-alpha-D-manno-heptose-7-phosphate kinase